MKKLTITFSLLLSVMAACAQEWEIVGDAYERKEVVEVEGVSASVLYDRAMIALSEWTGSDGQSKIGIDYQNLETHTLIYKGTCHLSFKNVLLGAGWNRYLNFTLKVRCKDGKAQQTLSLGSVRGVYTDNRAEKEVSMKEIVDNVAKTTNKKRLEFFTDVMETANGIMTNLADRLRGDGVSNDDDF